LRDARAINSAVPITPPVRGPAGPTGRGAAVTAREGAGQKRVARRVKGEIDATKGDRRDKPRGGRTGAPPGPTEMPGQEETHQEERPKAVFHTELKKVVVRETVRVVKIDTVNGDRYAVRGVGPAEEARPPAEKRTLDQGGQGGPPNGRARPTENVAPF
jgi:hypothetical protein